MASSSTAPLTAFHSTQDSVLTSIPTTPEKPAAIAEQTCTVEQRPQAPLPARRHVLFSGGIAAFSAMSATITHLLSTTPATPALAQDDPAPRPLMRSTAARAAQAMAAPALPPLALIALNRMGFGPRPGDIAAFTALGATPEAGLTAYIEQQLQPESIDDSACDALIASYGFTTLGKSLEQLWADHVKKQGLTYSERIQPVEETRKTAFLRALYSKRQLVEVLAYHWHNHFNIYGWDSWTAPVFVHYDRDVIRANMLGNFR